MTDKPTSLGESIRTVRAACPSRITLTVVMLVVLLSCAGIAAGQDLQGTFGDDFEDGNADGWTLREAGGSWSVDQTGTVGNHSLVGETQGSGDAVRATWTNGPVLDMTKEFSVEGVVKPEFIDVEPNRQVRVGIRSGNATEVGGNAFLQFDREAGVTYLSTSSLQTSADSNDTISNSFDGEWVRFRLESDADSDILEATVWEVGTTEPSSPQLTREFSGVSGQFIVSVGNNFDRRASLDQVEITGAQRIADNLTIKTSGLLRHGESQPYTVELTEFDDDLGRNVTRDVTDEANITSQNTDGITVDQTNHTLLATSDTSFNDRVTIRAEHPNVTGAAYTEVAVTTVEMENLEILPPVYRIGAFLGDWTVFLLIISIGAGIVGTRGATAFMGLSMMELVLIIGWFGGYLSTGLMMVSVFACLFIGLNLAANIDYQVQR